MQPHPLAQRLYPQLIRWQRALHQIPEKGNEEHKTRAYLRGQLSAMSPDVLEPVADTGIKCVFLVPHPSKTVRTLAFRSDMDALPTPEMTGLPHASRHEGMMHACGHDAHMAALLGVAACCAALRAAGKLPCHVVLLFQPAEETTGGARRMVQAGVLDNPHVDEIFGLHVMPDVPLGRVACCEGGMMAGDYEFDMEIVGRSAHGAMPHQGINSLDAAAALYTRLKAIPQTVAPGELALVNIGQLQSGTNRNIVPEKSRMEGTVRIYTNETLARVKGQIERAAAGIAAAHDVVVTHRDVVYFPPVINPRHLVNALAQALQGEMITQQPLLIAEDFSYYQQERPGLFLFMGTGSRGHEHPLHSNRFHYEDEALVTALSVHLLLLFARANAKER